MTKRQTYTWGQPAIHGLPSNGSSLRVSPVQRCRPPAASTEPDTLWAAPADVGRPSHPSAHSDCEPVPWVPNRSHQESGQVCFLIQCLHFSRKEKTDVCVNEKKVVFRQQKGNYLFGGRGASVFRMSVSEEGPRARGDSSQRGCAFLAAGPSQVWRKITEENRCKSPQAPDEDAHTVMGRCCDSAAEPTFVPPTMTGPLRLGSRCSRATCVLGTSPREKMKSTSGRERRPRQTLSTPCITGRGKDSGPRHPGLNPGSAT